MPEEIGSFSSVKERLNEIAEEVSNEDITLDDALALYEEAVKLGLAACDLSEADLAEINGEEQERADEALQGSPMPEPEPVREPITDDIPYTGVEVG